jgi:nucleoside-diphosphate-sugar epimerase
MKIAILGATSHIAKGLIFHFKRHDQYDLVLFARSREKVVDFLRSINAGNNTEALALEEFNKGMYDVIINCIGIGQPVTLKAQPALIFGLTELYDNLIIDYLSHHPDKLYINFSSGAVYGADRSQPASDSTSALLDINHLNPENYYMIAKINSEAKHRSYGLLKIVDLRVFAYFSRFIDLDSQYFLTEIISCIKADKVFITSPQNMIRDYIHPDDLFALVVKCIERFTGNDAFDVFSLNPVDKLSLLAFFRDNFRLKYTIEEKMSFASATGNKNSYYSLSRKAQMIGYYPRFSSIESVKEESAAVLAK